MSGGSESSEILNLYREELQQKQTVKSLDLIDKQFQSLCLSILSVALYDIFRDLRCEEVKKGYSFFESTDAVFWFDALNIPIEDGLVITKKYIKTYCTASPNAIERKMQKKKSN